MRIPLSWLLKIGLSPSKTGAGTILRTVVVFHVRDSPNTTKVIPLHFTLNIFTFASFTFSKILLRLQSSTSTDFQSSTTNSQLHSHVIKKSLMGRLHARPFCEMYGTSACINWGGFRPSSLSTQKKFPPKLFSPFLTNDTSHTYYEKSLQSAC